MSGFNRTLLHNIFNLASRFHNDEAGARGLLSGVVLATVFYEPSTRTSCSHTLPQLPPQSIPTSSPFFILSKHVAPS